MVKVYYFRSTVRIPDFADCGASGTEEGPLKSIERVVEVLNKGKIIALKVLHAAAHPRKAFAETKVVGGIGFRRFAGGPVPVTAILEVDDVDGMIFHYGAFLLEAEVVHATDAFLENLRAHDGAADGENDAVIETFNGAAEDLEIDGGGASDESAVEDGVVGNDIVADARVDGERDVMAESGGEDGGVLPAVFKAVGAFRDFLLGLSMDQFPKRQLTFPFSAILLYGAKLGAVVLNKPTKCATVTFVLEQAGV